MKKKFELVFTREFLRRFMRDSSLRFCVFVVFVCSGFLV